MKYRVTRPYSNELVGVLDSYDGMIRRTSVPRFDWCVGKPAKQLVDHCKKNRLKVQCSDTGIIWNDIVWRLI